MYSPLNISFTRLQGVIDLNAKKIDPALYKVEQRTRKKRDVVNSIHWGNEREATVRNAKKDYFTFNEDFDLICLLFVHKFQALHKGLLERVP